MSDPKPEICFNSNHVKELASYELSDGQAAHLETKVLAVPQDHLAEAFALMPQQDLQNFLTEFSWLVSLRKNPASAVEMDTAFQIFNLLPPSENTRNAIFTLLLNPENFHSDTHRELAFQRLESTIEFSDLSRLIPFRDGLPKKYQKKLDKIIHQTFFRYFADKSRQTTNVSALTDVIFDYAYPLLFDGEGDIAVLLRMVEKASDVVCVLENTGDKTKAFLKFIDLVGRVDPKHEKEWDSTFDTVVNQCKVNRSYLPRFDKYFYRDIKFSKGKALEAYLRIIGALGEHEHLEKYIYPEIKGLAAQEFSTCLLIIRELGKHEDLETYVYSELGSLTGEDLSNYLAIVRELGNKDDIKKLRKIKNSLPLKDSRRDEIKSTMEYLN